HPAAGLLHAPHRHAEVLGLDHDSDAIWIERVHDRLRDLARELLLDLRPPREPLDHPRQLADADDAAVGYIANVSTPVKGQKVVLAHAVKGDIAEDHHLVVGNLEAHLQVPRRILRQPGEDLRVHRCDAPWRFPEPLTFGILSDRLEELDDRRLYTRL